MDNKNKIEIYTSVNSTEFDQKISDIQKKLKSLRETGPSGTYAQLAQTYRSQGNEQAAQRTEQYRENVNKQLRTQLARDLQQQESLLNKNESAQKRVRDSLENTLKTQQNINKAKELEISLAERHLKISENISNINKAMIATGGGAGGGNIPLGPRGPAGPGGGPLANLLANIGLPKILGAAGTALATGGQFYKQIATYPERITQREAQISDMLSETARLQANRRGYEMALYGPERMRALQRAQTRVGAEKVTDITELGGTVLGGAAVGAGLAAKFASPLLAAPMGAGIPLYLGAMGLGALGGGATAFGGAMMASDRKRSMLFDRDAYQKEMGAVFSGTYKEQLELEKRKSFEKDLAAQFLESNSSRFRGLQRQFGLSDQELFLGKESIFRRGAAAGYDMDSITQAMQGIAAAGGSTAVGRTGGQIAAQMQRNLNLTNAPELLGRISGGYGMNAIQSKDELLRLHIQAVSEGLDQSETRNYMQAAADMGYKTGGDLETIAKMLMSGIEGSGLKTPRGIEAAQEAMQTLREQTGEMGGLTGQYQLAGFGSKEITGLLGKKALTLKERARLAGTSSDQITDQYVRSLFESRGMEVDEGKVQELKTEILKTKAGAVTRTKAQEEAAMKWYEVSKNPSAYSEKEKNLAKKAYEEEFGIVGGREFLSKSEATKGAIAAQVGAALKGEAYKGPTEEQIAAEEAKLKKAPERLLDKKEAATAMFDTAGSLSNLKTKSDELASAFQKTIDMGEKAAKLGEMFGKLDYLQQLIDKSNATPEQKKEWENALRMQQEAAKNVAPTNYGPGEKR